MKLSAILLLVMLITHRALAEKTEKLRHPTICSTEEQYDFGDKSLATEAIKTCQTDESQVFDLVRHFKKDGWTVESIEHKETQKQWKVVLKLMQIQMQWSTQ